jgi:hypothetical protein
LYGDSQTEAGPGFVHIEEISARSKENNWVITPHRHSGLFQVLFLPAYFSRFFRARVSTSPSEYRKANNYETHSV